MVAEDFLWARKWLDGVEPTWTLLTFRGLRPYGGDETICFFARELRQPG